MSKKKRDERNLSEPAALKHNPFAALAARAVPAPIATTGEQERSEGSCEGAMHSRAEQKLAASERVTAAEQGVADAPPSTSAPQGKAVQGTKGALPVAQAQLERTKSRGRLVLRRETKGRGGKAVIIVTGFAAIHGFDESQILALAQKLKQQLGCGGTVEEKRGEREIILQGDRAAKVAELLRAQNFRVDGVTS